MARVAKPHIDIKEACVRAAHKFIVRHGVEALSMREIARSVGVSHQAPYKHFANRDELLAEVMRRCFRAFATFLEGREHQDDPEDDLRSMGERYLQYAMRHPLEYRLMFAVTWPDVASGSELNADASYALDILRRAGRHLGLAFQVVDDILDATADTKTLGKTAGKDAKAGKTTFVALHGIEESRRIANRESQAAKAAFGKLKANTEFLVSLAESMGRRVN